MSGRKDVALDIKNGPHGPVLSAEFQFESAACDHFGLFDDHFGLFN